MAIEPGVKPKPRETNRLTPCGKETMMDLIIKFICDEVGAPALEYALLLALLAIGLLSAITTIGNSLTGIFTRVSGNLTGGS
jgi:pilus assembly protein Flp/PilA